ncbi:MAG: hypothetical protein GF421_03560 [Candidatus Aminicenantes bacterium]|nr:hypothetical protein [Candidatus Aminicenantes bacterium]
MIYKRRGRKISFVIDWMYGVLPFIGWIFNQMDPISVYNKKAKYRFVEKLRNKTERNYVYDKCRKKKGRIPKFSSMILPE